MRESNLIKLAPFGDEWLSKDIDSEDDLAVVTAG
jgi:hypothetical protein